MATPPQTLSDEQCRILIRTTRQLAGPAPSLKDDSRFLQIVVPNSTLPIWVAFNCLGTVIRIELQYDKGDMNDGRYVAVVCIYSQRSIEDI